MLGKISTGKIEFDEKRDGLGNGGFQDVSRCRYGDAGELYAAKQVPKRQFDRGDGEKETKALLHAQVSGDGGHRNVIRCVVATPQCEWGMR